MIVAWDSGLTFATRSSQAPGESFSASSPRFTTVSNETTPSTFGSFPSTTTTWERAGQRPRTSITFASSFSFETTRTFAAQSRRMYSTCGARYVV